jgi:hypothetical protein
VKRADRQAGTERGRWAKPALGLVSVPQPIFQTRQRGQPAWVKPKVSASLATNSRVPARTLHSELSQSDARVSRRARFRRTRIMLRTGGAGRRLLPPSASVWPPTRRWTCSGLAGARGYCSKENAVADLLRLRCSTTTRRCGVFSDVRAKAGEGRQPELSGNLRLGEAERKELWLSRQARRMEKRFTTLADKTSIFKIKIVWNSSNEKHEYEAITKMGGFMLTKPYSSSFRFSLNL